MSEEKNNHVLLKAIGVTAAVGAGAYAGSGYYVFSNAFDLQHSNLYASRNIKRIHIDFGEKDEWFTKSKREDEFMDSYDRLKLHALSIRNHDDSHKWMIIAQGLSTYGTAMMNHLYEADQRGYNILLTDARGCGMSEGRYTTLGWSEHYDLISWVNYVINLDPDAKIFLYGLNVGAAAVMNAAGDYVPGNVKCAVEDGGFSDIKEEILYQITKHCKLNGRFLMPAVDFYVKQFLHFSLNDISTKRQLKEGNLPMFFIHGADDDVVPTSMLFDNYYAYAGEKELWNVEKAGFEETDLAEDYYAKVFDFAEKYM